MNWDYSDLSHQAKQAGGPEKFVKDIETFNYNNGLRDGKAEQAKEDFIIAAGVVIVSVIVKKVLKKKHSKKAKEPEISAEQAEKSRQRLILIIKNSEAKKPTVDELEEEEIDENDKMC